MSQTNTRQSWTESDTRNLLEIWQDNLKKLRSARRKNKVFDNMAKELEKHCAKRTGAQLQTKIENLTKKYRQIKKTKVTGVSPSRWPFYFDVHRILGGLPANDPDLIDESLSVEDINPKPIDVDPKQKTTGFSPKALKSPRKIYVDLEGKEFIIDESTLSQSSDQATPPAAEIRELPDSILSEKIVAEPVPKVHVEIEGNSGSKIRKIVDDKLQSKRKKNNTLQEMVAIQKELVGKYDESRKEEQQISKQQLALQERALQLQERMVSAIEQMFASNTNKNTTEE